MIKGVDSTRVVYNCASSYADNVYKRHE